MLGTGKIFWGLCGLLSLYRFNTLAFTTKKISTTREEDVFLEDSRGVYRRFKVLYISDEFDTGQIENLIHPDVNIYIVNVNAHKEYFARAGDILGISCCKTGLSETYVPILNEAGCTGQIVAIDNNKEIAKAANSELVNIDVKSAVIHMFCSKEPVEDKEHNKRIARAQRPAYLVFPPGCDSFKKLIYRSFSLPVSIVYSKTYKEYELAILEKLINVNIPHTLMALLAWETLNYPKDKTVRFSDLSPGEFEKLKSICIEAHQYLCSIYLTDNYDYYSGIAEMSIDNLFLLGDSLSRIIDPKSKDSLAKLDMHMQYISKVPVEVYDFKTIILQLNKLY